MLDLPESETGFQIMLVFQRFICAKQNNDTEIMESCPFMFQSDSSASKMVVRNHALKCITGLFGPKIPSAILLRHIQNRIVWFT